MKVDKRKKVNPEVLKKMRELRSQGMTYQKIAKELNLSYLTVYKYLNIEKYQKVKTEPKEGAAVPKEGAAAEKKPGFWSRLKAKLGS
ncbi:MAG: helix-turn-helix domain-containing protein [Candidatus Hadarchaeum sp.]|uniref:helix-turn-helix domain-containing protein n=1 Tax=Candidatus Hadarchaeum sp. TaxID=2883567 RepID=UPI003D0BAADB